METLIKLWLPVLVGSSLGLMPCHANDSNQSTPDAKIEEKAKSLGDYMSVISDSLKAMRKVDRDEDWKKGAELARQASDAAFHCIQKIPQNISNIPDQAIQQRAMADYRRLSALAYASLCQLELAYLAEDADAVKAAKSEVFAIRKEGHDKYES